MSPSACVLFVLLSVLQAPAPVSYVLDYDTGRVERRAGGEVVWASAVRGHLFHPSLAERRKGGTLVWSTTLGGQLGGGGPPYAVWDERRVCFPHDDGITAFDAATGKLAWHTKTSANNDLLLSGGLLLATNTRRPGRAKDGHVLVARRAETGAEAFRVRLPDEARDLLPLQAVAGLFAVQTRPERSGGAADARLVDRTGRVLYRTGREVVGGVRRGLDVVLFTGTGVVYLEGGSRERWSRDFLTRHSMPGSGLVDVPGGDLLAYRYGYSDHDGVAVLRLSPEGKVRWEARCAGLNVDSISGYRHDAFVTVEGARVKVESKGSDGRFTEVLDLGSGKQLSRKQKRGGDGSPRTGAYIAPGAVPVVVVVEGVGAALHPFIQWATSLQKSRE